MGILDTDGGRSVRRPSRSARYTLAPEEGLGLIEVLTAVLVLGLVLAALASGLVSTLRETSRNQALVQATAVHQAILESTIALPWELIGVYSDDANYRSSVVEDGDTFPTVSLGPAAGTPDSRVPAAVHTVTRDNRTYDVRTDIYWVDTDANGTHDSKRIRTTLSWSVGARTFQNQFHATRAPSTEEGEGSFEILTFQPSRSEVQLDSDGRTTTPLEFVVVTTDPAFPGTLVYSTPGGDVSLTLSSSNADDTNFTATIPAGAEVSWGDQLVELTILSKDSPSSTAVAAVTVTFIPEGGLPDPDPTPTDSPSPTPTNPDELDIERVEIAGATRLTYKSQNNKSCAFVIEVEVEGITSEAEGTVEISYPYWTRGNDTDGSHPDRTAAVQATFSRQSGDDGIFRASVSRYAHYFYPHDSLVISAHATKVGTTATSTEQITVSSGAGSC